MSKKWSRQEDDILKSGGTEPRVNRSFLDLLPNRTLRAIEVRRSKLGLIGRLPADYKTNGHYKLQIDLTLSEYETLKNVAANAQMKLATFIRWTICQLGEGWNELETDLND